MTTTLSPTGPPALDAPAPSPISGPDPRGRLELGALAVLLAGTAVLYLWHLDGSGWANSFYSGAVQAMTKNWEAFLFGSSDAGNIVTVDKPPAALWVMALSARIFGLSSWSVLVPQALMGVGTVALLSAAVRRVAGSIAGLVAGTAMALTPVAALMFRYNNPDALLVLLMVGAAYATVRAIEKAGTRWLVLAGALIGLAFLTKMAQGFLVLPALALAYLWAAPTSLGRRIRQLAAAGVAVVTVGGWWYALVELWPAGTRPYIGGSTDNSALGLALGYNGLGRVFGLHAAGRGLPGGGFPTGFGSPRGADLPGAGGFPGGGGGGFGGRAGLTRMFASEVGGQVSWLLPAALALFLVGLWLTRRTPRTDPLRAALLLWGGWTVVTGLVFSLMTGIFHQYYTVALAPGIAGLVGVGGAVLWHHRSSPAGRAALATLTAGTAAWAWVLLSRIPEFLPALRWAVVGLGMLATVLLLVPASSRRWAALSLITALITGTAAPAAYAIDTVETAHSGGIVTAGPTTIAGGPFGIPTGQTSDRGDRGAQSDGLAGNAPGSTANARADRTRSGVGGGIPGEQETVDPAIVSLLKSAGTKWAAATLGASSAAPLALASDTTIMGIGGFMGSDPAPTLQQFQAYVATGQVHYFLPGGGPRGGAIGNFSRDASSEATRRASTEISQWVEQHFTATTVGGRTVYDLTASEYR
ncbi:MAG TPA: glycosyltransferase family 39 protein [Pseudonocardiaceae bacterium]|nr:glycosyltransferase family 39 protein [Pseudonocardiaceae bacterium]